MKKIISILLFLSLVASSFVCSAAEIRTVDKTILYVATDGNDNNEGTFESPLASIAGARDKIRALKSSGSLGRDGAVVYIRGGRYSVAETLKFTQQDSGTKEAPITYRAYQDEEVKLMGGIIIPFGKFKKTTDSSILNQIIDEAARDKIVQIDLRNIGYKGQLPHLRDGEREGEPVPEKTLVNPVSLYVGNTTMDLARYPNGSKMMGMAKLVKMCQDVDFWLERKYTDSRFIPKDQRDPTDPLIFVPDDERYLLWPEDSGTSVLRGMFGTGWAWNDALYTIDKEVKQISTKYPLMFLESVGPGKSTFYSYNNLCELDNEYEMWISDKGILYCVLPDNASSEDIFVETCSDAIISLEQGAQYITLRGLRFSNAKTSISSKSGTSNNLVYDCYFNNTKVSIGGSDNGIRNCNFDNATATLTGGDIEKLTSCENYIENCDFTNGSQATINGGVGSRISYNDIHDSDNSAIFSGGKKHIIEYNDVYDVCKYVADAGAMYSCGISKGGVCDRGNIYRYNYIHRINSNHPIEGGLSGIYNDDCMSGSLIVGNIIEEINHGKGRAIHLGGSNDTIVDNNIFKDVKTSVLFDERASWSTVKDPANSIILINLYQANKGYFTNEYWRAEFPELYERFKEIDPNTFAEAWNCRKTNNIGINAGSDSIANSFKYLTIENNYETNKDPGFVDMENGNFILREDSPVLKEIDFKQIPVTRIGRYSDRAFQRIKKAVVLKNDSKYAFSKGEKVSIGTDEAPLTPIEIDGSYYIPLRFVSEGMDCEVSWNAETNSADITTKEGDKLTITLNSTKAIKNGEEIELAMAPVLYNDSTYVPLRAFSESIGYVVFWDDSGLICVSDDNRFNPEADKQIITYLADELNAY